MSIGIRIGLLATALEILTYSLIFLFWPGGAKRFGAWCGFDVNIAIESAGSEFTPTLRSNEMPRPGDYIGGTVELPRVIGLPRKAWEEETKKEKVQSG